MTDYMGQMEAIRFLTENQDLLGKFLEDAQTKEAKALKSELEIIVFEHFAKTGQQQQAVWDLGNSDTRRQLFIVGVESRYPALVVANYVIRAIRDHAEVDPQKPFDHKPKPSFTIKSVPILAFDSALRQAIHDAKSMRDAMEPFFGSVK